MFVHTFLNNFTISSSAALTFFLFLIVWASSCKLVPVAASDSANHSIDVIEQLRQKFIVHHNLSQKQNSHRDTMMFPFVAQVGAGCPLIHTFLLPKRRWATITQRNGEMQQFQATKLVLRFCHSAIPLMLLQAPKWLAPPRCLTKKEWEEEREMEFCSWQVGN